MARAFLAALIAAAASAPALWAETVPARTAEAAGGQPGDLCVSNAADETLLFVAELRGGPREVRMLAPAESLCLPNPEGRGGIVSVYENEEVLEGCSRLVPPGGRDTLERYAEFDRCAWASHRQ